MYVGTNDPSLLNYFSQSRLLTMRSKPNYFEVVLFGVFVIVVVVVNVVFAVVDVVLLLFLLLLLLTLH